MIMVVVVLIPSLTAQTFKIAGSTPGAAVNLFWNVCGFKLLEEEQDHWIGG